MYVSVALVPCEMVWLGGDVRVTAAGTSVTVTDAEALTAACATPPASLKFTVAVLVITVLAAVDASADEAVSATAPSMSAAARRGLRLGELRTDVGFICSFLPSLRGIGV